MKNSGVLRSGFTGLQDKFQPYYFHYISDQERVTGFQSALKGSSTSVNSYAFLVDHAN